MSRRNGSQQVFNEFKGVIDGVPSIGSYVVIDVTRDLGLDDMLSASSLGHFFYKSVAHMIVSMGNLLSLTKMSN